MKTIIFFMASWLISVYAFGQDLMLNEIEIKATQYNNVLYNSVNEFLMGNVEYLQEFKSYNLQGTELIQFVVTPGGNLTDFKVINSLSPQVDSYIIEVLNATNGKWTPGTVNGKPVAMETEISVVFYLGPLEQLVKDSKHYQQKGNIWMFAKNNPVKALKFYNRGVELLPNEESLLAMRSLCRYQLGDKTGANSDWERLKVLAERNGSTTDEIIAGEIAGEPDVLKSFNHMINALMNYNSKNTYHD